MKAVLLAAEVALALVSVFVDNEPVGRLIDNEPVGHRVDYRWQAQPGYHQLNLMSGGVQVGGYNTRTGEYRPCDVTTGTWGPIQAPPIDPPTTSRKPGPLPAPRPGVQPPPTRRSS